MVDKKHLLFFSATDDSIHLYSFTTSYMKKTKCNRENFMHHPPFVSLLAENKNLPFDTPKGNIKEFIYR